MAKTSDSRIQEEVGTLDKLLSLPHPPISVRWEVEEQHAGATGTLRALLQFTPEQHQAIVDQSPAFDRRADEVLSAEEYAWLPKRVLADVDVVEEKGRYRLVGVEPRKADSFLKADLSPYVNGKITPLPGGYVFVTAYAM